MKQFKIFWDFEAEEKYLKDMAAKGYFLKKYSPFGVYHFQKAEPQAINYKIDYRLFKKKEDFLNYITLFEDAGWKHVYGTKYSGNQYFYPIHEAAGTEIFSDKISAATRYKTQYTLCMVNVIGFIAYLLMLFATTGGDLTQLLFLTPGLWERTGGAFWSAFFFELPFVILRLLPPIFLTIMAGFYGYWGKKSKAFYASQIHGEGMVK